MHANIQDVKKSITKRYKLALVLIALLSTIAFFALSSALKEAEHTAYLVNISGKQRMLSQHIALDVHRLHSHLTKKSTPASYAEKSYKNALRKHTQEMEQVNTLLSTGILSQDKTILLSEDIHKLYFGKANIAQRVFNYVTLANQALKPLKHSALDTIVHDINDHSEALLLDLNKIVLQYQSEGEVMLSKIESMETFIWITTLFVLLFEVILIFQPMVAKMLKLSESNETTLQNLENLVELRTLHLENANKKLKDLASHDPLTGLRNRLNLENDVELSITNFKKHNAPFAILMFDIDWFKKVNDSYGHDTGDQVLKEVSNILDQTVRDEDHIYRAGGEEFVVLLNRISKVDSIKIANKIRLKIEKHSFACEECHDKELFITISGGAYHSDMSLITDLKGLLKLVDEALYNAKHSGRNQIKEVEES